MQCWSLICISSKNSYCSFPGFLSSAFCLMNIIEWVVKKIPLLLVFFIEQVFPLHHYLVNSQLCQGVFLGRAVLPGQSFKTEYEFFLKILIFGVY